MIGCLIGSQQADSSIRFVGVLRCGARGVSEALIHFEHCTGTDAVHLLQRYRDNCCVYNDDVRIREGHHSGRNNLRGEVQEHEARGQKYLFFSTELRRYLNFWRDGYDLTDMTCGIGGFTVLHAAEITSSLH